MKQCIIFGAGHYGKGAYYKLKDHYNILYYIDNNVSLQGTNLYNIPILSLEEVIPLFNRETMDIIICSQAYFQIASQLMEVGIQQFYVMLEGFLYSYGNTEVMMPVELVSPEYYKKRGEEKSILFLQNRACIRTHKIAQIMKRKGYRVFLFYTIFPPVENYADYYSTYEKIYTTFTASSMIDFISYSDFDVIHSSNEPDSLTNYVQLSGKKVVFDTHDMMSIRGAVDFNALALEYLANTKSAGVIYTSGGVLEIARKKYKLDKQKTFVLENLIMDQHRIEKKYNKLSTVDGEIHCVYEGGVVGGNQSHHRFFEDIWKRITDERVHIHFYSQSDENYCRQLESISPFLHFEGNMGSDQLILEMTKYDCGLAVFNVNSKNRVFLETGTANKVYEYINSGLPVVVGDVDSYIQFVENYGVGLHLNMNGKIKEQLQEACKISIEEDFLIRNRLTMVSRGDELEAFYQSVIKG